MFIPNQKLKVLREVVFEDLLFLSSLDIYDLHGRRSFIHPIILLAQGKKYQSKTLVDTCGNAYLFIDEKEV